jgi:GDPmannose 4,6-dehydratase
MAPQSPYAAAKLYAYWLVRQYREAFGLFSVNGILFNHESPRRGETFVTRKITRGLSAIQRGEIDCIYLGNLDAKRDWGHARDYARGMIKIMESPIPEDYVLATGIQHTVREFFILAAKIAGFNVEIVGEGVNEMAIDTSTGKTIMKIDPIYFRPNEVPDLCGDSSKARENLGWSPQISFEQLVEEMVIADLTKSN